MGESVCGFWVVVYEGKEDGGGMGDGQKRKRAPFYLCEPAWFEERGEQTPTFSKYAFPCEESTCFHGLAQVASTLLFRRP